MSVKNGARPEFYRRMAHDDETVSDLKFGWEYRFKRAKFLEEIWEEGAEMATALKTAKRGEEAFELSRQLMTDLRHAHVKLCEIDRKFDAKLDTVIPKLREVANHVRRRLKEYDSEIDEFSGKLEAIDNAYTSLEKLVRKDVEAYQKLALSDATKDGIIAIKETIIKAQRRVIEKYRDKLKKLDAVHHA